MTTVNIATVLKQCEDYLFSARRLTNRERGLYYHLLRHTHAEGKPTALFALPTLAEALALSDSSVREDLRSVEEKGCIRIEERSRKGHLVRVLLPEEIEGVIPTAAPAPALDLERLDFFTGRRFVAVLLDREEHRCFYCLNGISAETCELDHAVSRATGADNSYRNIVASCHDCHTTKQASAPAVFLRTLYRRNRLSSAELKERLAALEQLQSGKRVPNAAMVAAAI